MRATPPAARIPPPGPVIGSEPPPPPVPGTPVTEGDADALGDALGDTDELGDTDALGDTGADLLGDADADLLGDEPGDAGTDALGDASGVPMRSGIRVLLSLGSASPPLIGSMDIRISTVVSAGASGWALMMKPPVTGVGQPSQMYSSSCLTQFAVRLSAENVQP